jgi:hypothetical protein
MAHQIVCLVCRLFEFILIALMFGCSMWLSCCAVWFTRFAL